MSSSEMHTKQVTPLKPHELAYEKYEHVSKDTSRPPILYDAGDKQLYYEVWPNTVESWTQNFGTLADYPLDDLLNNVIAGEKATWTELEESIKQSLQAAASMFDEERAATKSLWVARLAVAFDRVVQWIEHHEAASNSEIERLRDGSQEEKARAEKWREVMQGFRDMRKENCDLGVRIQREFSEMM